MKPHPDINSTFNSIKNLPVEIDYSGIEHFVMSQPATVFTLKTIFSSTKIIFMTTGIATIITTAVLFFTTNTKSDIPTEATTLIVKKEIFPEQPMVNIPQNAIQESTENIPSVPQEKKQPNTTAQIALANPLNMLFPDIAGNLQLDDTTKRKTSVAVSSGSSYSYSNVSVGGTANSSCTTSVISGNNAYITSYSGNNNEGENVVYTFTTYPCEKGNAYEAIIEQALLADGYIKSDNKYKYEITAKGFSVDGNQKGEAARDKYYQLLIDNSCMILNGNYAFAFAKKGDSISISTSSCD